MDRESSLLEVPYSKYDSEDDRKSDRTNVETDTKTISKNISDLRSDNTHKDNTYPVYRWTGEFFSYLYRQHYYQE